MAHFPHFCAKTLFSSSVLHRFYFKWWILLCVVIGFFAQPHLFPLPRHFCPRTYQIPSFCYTWTGIGPSKPFQTCSGPHRYLLSLNYCHIFCVCSPCGTWKMFFHLVMSSVFRSTSPLSLQGSLICWFLWDLTLKRRWLRGEGSEWWAASDATSYGGGVGQQSCYYFSVSAWTGRPVHDIPVCLPCPSRLPGL